VYSIHTAPGLSTSKSKTDTFDHINNPTHMPFAFENMVICLIACHLYPWITLVIIIHEYQILDIPHNNIA